MKIGMITSQALPFWMEDELGERVASLAHELHSQGGQVTIFMPFYSQLYDSCCTLEKVCSFTVKMNWRSQESFLWKTKWKGITYYFIGNDYYFNREKNLGYDDDPERFAFFQLAVLEALKEENIQLDILHSFDYETAMIPFLLSYQKQRRTKLPKMILSVLHPEREGRVSFTSLFDFFNVPDTYYFNGMTRYDNEVNYLKTGLVFATRILLDEKYCHSCTNEDFPLHEIFEIEKKKIIGIPSAMDKKIWNPLTDRHLFHPYGPDSVLKNKAMNKLRFCSASSFAHPEYPLYGILLPGKEMQWMMPLFSSLMERKINLLVLAPTDDEIRNPCAFFQNIYRGNFRLDLRKELPYFHQVLASLDFLILSAPGATREKAIASRYGVIPLCACPGGDRMEEQPEFFFKEKNPESFLKAIDLSLELYDKKRLFSKAIHAGMNDVFSDENIIGYYLSVYASKKGVR